MSKLIPSSAAPLRPGPAKDPSDPFKSFKQSLSQSLDRLEAIGISDSEAPDDLTSLKAQLAQNERIIQDQSAIISRLSSHLSALSSPSKPPSDISVDTSRRLSACLINLQDFPDFAKSCKLSSSELASAVQCNSPLSALASVLTAFTDFIEYSKQANPAKPAKPAKPTGRPALADSYDSRSRQSANNLSRASKYSDLDQAISQQKRIFSDLCN